MFARLYQWLFARMFRKELEGTAQLDLKPFCTSCGGLTAVKQERFGVAKFSCAACGSEFFFRGWGAERDKAIVYHLNPEDSEAAAVNYPRVEA
jgi:predicted RNA-binding Zn-ribbon protein involved in translation (DUF1610 family)